MQIGTDINKIDTDNDGLTDYFEVMSMVYDPTKIDTDNNGVNDGEEDLDNDGLFNLKEIELKTDIDNNDTDRDGLLDGEEVNVYNTAPCNYDTDGDFVSDKKEIELGTDPLSFNEKFDVTLKAEGVDTVKVAVNVTLTGEQFNTLSVNKVNNDFLFPCDMPGYIGGAYEFKVDGEFDTATLYFEFDKELLKSEDFDPVIYYFNEEKQELEELETKILGNVASTVTTHFSKYILLNRKLFSGKICDWADSWTSEKPKETEMILSIGDYDSMGGAFQYNLDTGFFTYGTDPQHKRFEIAKSVIDRFDENNKIGIAKVDDNIEMLTENLISCDDEGKKILKNYLKFTEDKDGIDKKRIFDSTGRENYFYVSTFAQANQFRDHNEVGYLEWEEKYADAYKESRDEKQKCIIAFVGGTPSEMDRKYFDSALEACQKIGVKVFIIAFDYEDDHYLRDYYDNVYALFAESTGGRLYYADDFMAVNKIYDEIFIGADISIDSDNDGIPDKYEDGLTLFNGSRIKLDKNNPDTDGDGLLDGEEVKIIREYELVDGKMGIRVRGKAFTDPANPDTDGDLEGDATDPTPNDFMLNEILCEKIYKLDELAKDYIEDSGIPIMPLDLSKGRKWLTFMFIRQFNSNYVGGNWNGTAGVIDYHFVEYVKNYAPELYSYFENHSDYIADINGDMGDLYHLAATVSALIYESTYGDGVLFGLMPEIRIDSLAGWAGDLQTAMNDARLAVGEKTDYFAYKEAMDDLIACNNSDKVYVKYPNLMELLNQNSGIHFEQDDLYADVDAVNLYKLLYYKYSLDEALHEYMKVGYKDRFTQFLTELDRGNNGYLQDAIYTYTTEYYFMKININMYFFKLSSKWPLLDEDIDKNLSIAAVDSFVEYITKKILLEKYEKK